MEQFVSLWGIEFCCTAAPRVISSTAFSHSLSNSSIFLMHVSSKGYKMVFCLLKRVTCYIVASINHQRLYGIVICVAQGSRLDILVPWRHSDPSTSQTASITSVSVLLSIWHFDLQLSWPHFVIQYLFLLNVFLNFTTYSAQFTPRLQLDIHFICVNSCALVSACAL